MTVRTVSKLFRTSLFQNRNPTPALREAYPKGAPNTAEKISMCMYDLSVVFGEGVRHLHLAQVQVRTGGANWERGNFDLGRN